MDLLELARLLQHGGPYAVSTLFAFAIVFLARAYVRARDKSDARNREFSERLLETQSDIAKHMGDTSKALEVMDRRLERIEYQQATR